MQSVPNGSNSPADGDNNRFYFLCVSLFNQSFNVWPEEGAASGKYICSLFTFVFPSLLVSEILGILRNFHYLRNNICDYFCDFLKKNITHFLTLYMFL